MTPDAHDPAETAFLTRLRHDLHRRPELSGEEVETARTIAALLADTRPDTLLTGLGGYGVAAVYDGAAPGPTLMFRAELDALPIAETGTPPHRSGSPGKGHLCGHDGHMAILIGLARRLGQSRPARGRVVTLFQPAEEDGSGAAAVLADPRFAAIAPDRSFALHNFPGLPQGRVMLGTGPVNCASRGLRIRLTGRTSHASEPEKGLSPAPALAALMPALAALSGGEGPDFRLVTITHASMGAPAFGIAPGEAELWVTLRTLTDSGMDALVAEAEALVGRAAQEHRLASGITHHDIFAHCENAPEATARIARALDALGLPHGPEGLPMRASEDFGRFGQTAPEAMLFLGAGTDTPALHDPDYDFPDALIPQGVAIFETIARQALGN